MVTSAVNPEKIYVLRVWNLFGYLAGRIVDRQDDQTPPKAATGVFGHFAFSDRSRGAAKERSHGREAVGYVDAR
jgi:hypothetical protein